ILRRSRTSRGETVTRAVSIRLILDAEHSSSSATSSQVSFAASRSRLSSKARRRRRTVGVSVPDTFPVRSGRSVHVSAAAMYRCCRNGTHWPGKKDYYAIPVRTVLIPASWRRSDTKTVATRSLAQRVQVGSARTRSVGKRQTSAGERERQRPRSGKGERDAYSRCHRPAVRCRRSDSGAAQTNAYGSTEHIGEVQGS